MELDDPILYLNRELSLLEFNARVLELAKDPQMPLLERLRYLSICSTNLDEFFEIRVAGLKQQVAFDIASNEADELAPNETLRQVHDRAHELVAEQYRVFNHVLVPALEKEGVELLRRDRWNDRVQEWVQGYFRSQVLPVLTPMGLDPAHPFPRILNKSLNFIVSVEGEDDFGRDSGVAVVQVPRSLPRVILAPTEANGNGLRFVLLSSVIHAHIGEVFPGMRVKGCYQFRVTRNSDLWVDEEETDDLLRALKGELAGRNYGDAVRLEVDDNCSEELSDFLLRTFQLEPDDVYRVDGPVNLHRAAAIYDACKRRDLKFPPFRPRMPQGREPERDIFAELRHGDLLLHHPYDAFTPVLELLRGAATDPEVLAVKITLYRTGSESPIVEALIDSARAGKDVTAVVELRARFDEAKNIQLATRLQEAGAKVVYGIVGYKCHAKMLMVVRREAEGLRRYVHLATGNYHAGTARAYTDFGLLTCDPEFGEDVHKLFMQLTGLGHVGNLAKLWQAPFTLQRRLITMIDEQAEQARTGAATRIVAKMNSLTEPKIIQALYRAAQAGVQIDLIVRGICCLRPGVEGVSTNIRVRSVLGRFLEHARVFWFEGPKGSEVFCASADWMQRNFFRRVETCFPIEEPALKRRVIDEGLEAYLRDDAHAWLLDVDGRYRRGEAAADGEVRPAQTWLLERMCGMSTRELEREEKKWVDPARLKKQKRKHKKQTRRTGS